MTHIEAVNSLASERYLLDEMSEQDREAFEAHYFECAECADDVTTAVRMRDGIRAGLLQTPHVARIATFTPAAKPAASAVTAPAAMLAQARAWYQSAMLPWAVAATLAVMVGYQAQQSTPGAAPGQRAEAVTPTLLRPSSRGAVPTISVGAPYAALALDIDAAGSTELVYELRNESGAVITSGRTAAPAAGAPLLIVIPSFTLKGEQRYSLTVRDAAQAGRGLGDYAFTTTP